MVEEVDEAGVRLEAVVEEMKLKRLLMVERLAVIIWQLP